MYQNSYFNKFKIDSSSDIYYFPQGATEQLTGMNYTFIRSKNCTDSFNGTCYEDSYKFRNSFFCILRVYFF